MRLQAYKEEEISNFDMIPDKAECRFEVTEAVEGESKAKNAMISLKVKVHYGEQTRVIFDYLVAGEKTAYKVRHFCDAVGMLAEYEAGNIDADALKGLTGKCIVGQQPAQNGYAAKNTIRDYVKSAGFAAAPVKAAKAAAKDDMDDEIPF